MGLFDRSKSTTNVTEQTETLNLGQDISGDGTAGVGFAGGNVTQLSTDQGAIGVGRDIALEALRTGGSGLSEVLDLGARVVDAGADQNRLVASSIADSGALLAGTLSDVARDNTQFAESIASGAQAGADRARSDTFDFAGDTVRDVLADVSSGRGDVIGLADRSRDFAGDIARDVISAQSASNADVLSFASGTTSDVIGAAGSFLDRAIEAVQTAGERFVSAAGSVYARESTNTDARLESVTKNALIVAAILGGAALLVPVFRK